MTGTTYTTILELFVQVIVIVVPNQQVYGKSVLLRRRGTHFYRNVSINTVIILRLADASHRRCRNFRIYIQRQVNVSFVSSYTLVKLFGIVLAMVVFI